MSKMVLLTVIHCNRHLFSNDGYGIGQNSLLSVTVTPVILFDTGKSKALLCFYCWMFYHFYSACNFLMSYTHLTKTFFRKRRFFLYFDTVSHIWYPISRDWVIHMPGSTESLSNNISQWASVGMGWCWQGMNRVRDMRAVRFMARPQQSLTIFFRRLRELLPLTKFRVSLLWRECQAVCFQFTHLPCDDWENIYTLSYHHHQIGSMSYYLLFRVRSWNNGIRCMSLYILKSSSRLNKQFSTQNSN